MNKVGFTNFKMQIKREKNTLNYLSKSLSLLFISYLFVGLSLL